jgi:hypothetical protein
MSLLREEDRNTKFLRYFARKKYLFLNHMIYCNRFVMNTQEEVEQAFLDYQNGVNGFESAKGWESEVTKQNKVRAS